MKKRIGSFILIACMLVSFAALPASAASRRAQMNVCEKTEAPCGLVCVFSDLLKNLKTALERILPSLGLQEENAALPGGEKDCGDGVCDVGKPAKNEDLPASENGGAREDAAEGENAAKENGKENGKEDGARENASNAAENVKEEPENLHEQAGDRNVGAFEERVAELVNAERAKRGLKPLKLSLKLSDGAREKSADMQKNRYFSHTSPTYGSPFDHMKRLGISYRTAGENIAMGYRTPEDVMNGWMNSPGHRANILNANFTEIGVGYVENGNYWTQWFTG